MPAIRVFTDVRTWLVPVALILGLSALLPSIYLAGTADPRAHLADLPAALVIEQQTDAAAAVAPVVADQIEEHAGDEIAFTRMSPTEMAAAMRDDRIAGAVVIPADFDRSIASLYPGSATISVPTVSIVTNAGDGGFSNGLLSGTLSPLLHGVSEGLGAQLLAAAGGAPLPAANAALLSDPFHVTSTAFEPLPERSGLGTSAFYYALILVLIAFVGASLVGPIVDSALGFSPSEVGPVVQRRPYTSLSRPATLIGKLVILIAAAPFAALATQIVATQVIGVPTAEPLTLWLFSTLAIAAVGSGALAVFAVFGSGIGALVNMIFFIALAMTSSGGTVPVEATPPFFHWISGFAPFRPIVDGVRSLFYFDGNPAAGLADAWVHVGVGGVIGIAVGLTATVLYGRVPAFTRDPLPARDTHVTA